MPPTNSSSQTPSKIFPHSEDELNKNKNELVNQFVNLESPNNKDIIENNNDEKNVNNNSEKQVINNTVESVDKRMLNIEKAGRTIKILGVTNILYSSIITFAISSSKSFDSFNIIILIIIICLSVFTYITGSKIKKNIIFAKKTGIALCILSFMNFPIGFILSIISLYYLKRGWNDVLVENIEITEEENDKLSGNNELNDHNNITQEEDKKIK